MRSEKVEVLYRSLNKNEEKKRLLAPYAVYFDPEGATLKLIALESSYGEIRVFSIDRILSVSPFGENFTRPLDFSLQSYLEENCFNGIHGPPVLVRLRATGITARIFAERKFHPSQKIIHKKQFRGDSPETVTIEMRVANGRGLIRFILSYLPDIEVVSPSEVREAVREVLQKSLDVNFRQNDS
jgi:predicted DNA-binding transcriptional regulator YafY